MRQLTGKVVSLPRTEYPRGAADGEFDAPADDHAALLAAMREHFLAGRGAGGVALVQQRELPPGALRGDQPQ